jgi:3-deoxy-D-manno-octulosonic-acid transferase
MVCFAPWDVAWIARRYFRALAPRLLICVDQVRLPFLLKGATMLGIRAILISASLSEVYIGSVHLKKALAYRFHEYFDRICVADEEDRRNYVRVGCDPAKLRVTGYMKFDTDYLRIGEAERHALRDLLGLARTEVVWIAGSVRRGEERLVMEAYARMRRSHPELRLILAPRYLGDVAEVCRVADEEGLKHIRRTQITGAAPAAVIVLDTYGELAKLYSVADVVFIGNSLCPGDEYALGQNIVEPLVHDKPVFFGPFMNKWRELTATLKEAWPGLEVRDSAELASNIERLLREPELQARVCARIAEVVEANGAAVENNFRAVAELIDSVSR